MFFRKSSEPSVTGSLMDLLQAIVEDDDKKVNAILDTNPRLLFMNPEALKIQEAEIEFNARRFVAARPFVMAQQVGLGMTKTLLTRFKMLGEEGAQAAREQWGIPCEEARELEDEKLLGHYKRLLQEEVMEVIAEDKYASNENMLEETEQALNDLRNGLFPEDALEIEAFNKYELFLFAACQVYNENLDNLTLDQQAVYAVRVRGLIESTLSKELAKILCTGLYDVVMNRKPITELAEQCLFGNKEPFYSSPSKLSGLGVKFLSGANGGEAPVESEPGRVSLLTEALLLELRRSRGESFDQIREQLFDANFTKQVRFSI